MHADHLDKYIYSRELSYVDKQEACIVRWLDRPASSRVMENPAPSIVVPPIAAPVSANFSRLAFRNLYIRRTGPGSREMVTVEGRRGSSDQTGDMRYVSDFPVYDGRGSDAVLVARVQGVTTTFGNSNQFFTVAFEAGRFFV